MARRGVDGVRHPHQRIACILRAHPTTLHTAAVNILSKFDGLWFDWRGATSNLLPLVHSGGVPKRPTFFDWIVYTVLALINTPRIIGQRQHMPHERTEREKLKQLGLVGKFPLRAWTEIVLKVALPDDRSGEPSKEAHLTGQKCLHFCRTHLRVRLGQLEYVEGHWRGDPALGIKQSRYRVEA